MQNHDGTISLDSQPKISQTDKLLFCVFLAVAFHALLFFGVGFKVPELSNSPLNKTFNVVLAQFESETKPEKADFIGQANQEAGGESEALLAPSATEKAQFNDPDSQSSEPQLPPMQQVNKKNTPELLASLEGTRKQQKKIDSQIESEKNIPDTQSLLQKSYELSGLIANLDNKQINQAKRSKKRQVSAAIHRSSDALYLDTWRRKIERIGNLNYPEKAKQDKIYGNLTLKVAINRNGTINQVSIMKSSGAKLLDDAAIRIVRLAAPFSPLTEEMKKDTEVLEIIRVWRFQEDNRVHTS
ncbi:MAG: TonB family protein [Kangiellaceae bacterium]|nr:TonB family protein [Kangiellaceae bacterium]